VYGSPQHAERLKLHWLNPDPNRCLSELSLFWPHPYLRFKSRSKLIVLRVFRADPTFISAVSGDVFMRAPAMEKRLLSLH
jgi:hypothetical protein